MSPPLGYCVLSSVNKEGQALALVCQKQVTPNAQDRGEGQGATLGLGASRKEFSGEGSDS